MTRARRRLPPHGGCGLPLVLICYTTLPAFAQAPPSVRIRSAAWFPPSAVISTDADLVEMVASVRDRKGRLVGGLHASDFKVLDESQVREITFFSEQKEQQGAVVAPGSRAAPAEGASPSAHPPNPRSIALFFDDAHASMRGVRKSAEAAEQLIENTLAPDDLVGIFTSSGVGWVDFTRDRKVLLAALAHLEAHQLSGVHASTVCPTLGSSEAFIITQHLDIAIEDAAVAEMISCNCRGEPGCESAQRAAVVSAAQNAWQQYEYQSAASLDAILIVVRHLDLAPGRRLLVIMSPGFPTGGMEDRTSALTDAALRGNITISAVNAEGLVTERLLARKLFVLSGFMADAAKSTGGRYLHDTNDLTGSLRAFVAVPEVSYVLGFSPGDPDGRYHSLKTQIRGNRQYRVESRPGYYAAVSQSKRESAQQRIDRVAMSSTDVKDFPGTLEVRQEQATLNVSVSVNVATLRFPETQGKRLQQLTFLTILEDAAGKFIAGKQSVMDLALTPDGLAATLEKGINAVTALPAPARGSYRVREVVREAAEDRLWAASSSIQVR